VAPQVVDGICAATNYSAASGKTKAQWAKEQVIRNIRQMAANGAMKTALASSKAVMNAAAIT
jgi:hypothetical protein